MTDITLSGSCLCGQVRYTATGKETRFYHCHCGRCRKATGTGHASNLFLEGSLTWLSGENQLSSYSPPGAQRFSNRFCRHCGSRMPKSFEQQSIVFIPAGSLDDEPQMQPQAHIFCGSRAAWSCAAAGLPEYDEYRTDS